MAATVRHLYLHLPFCPTVCPYCSFRVERVERGKMDAFADLLKREFERAGPLEALQTVYIGGGTPTAFSTGHLERIFALIGRFVPNLSDCETTLEANPSTLSPEKCRLIRDAGVNRVSLGAQSVDNAVLATLGRQHDAAAVRRAWDRLREAGFANLNLDLMFGVPGQDAACWRRTLQEALALRPEHVSAYNLTYEQDTPFMERLKSGHHRLDEELSEAMFVQAEDLLEAAGFLHYEISNYARPGFESRHNLGYWSGADYLGIGPGAVSTVGGRRWTSEADGPQPLEEVPAETRRRETALLELRTSRGTDPAAWEPSRWEPLVAHGLAALRDGRLVLTREGRLRADAIAVHLL